MAIFAREQVLPKCDDNRFAVSASGRPTVLNILRLGSEGLKTGRMGPLFCHRLDRARKAFCYREAPFGRVLAKGHIGSALGQAFPDATLLLFGWPSSCIRPRIRRASLLPSTFRIPGTIPIARIVGRAVQNHETRAGKTQYMHTHIYQNSGHKTRSGYPCLYSSPYFIWICLVAKPNPRPRAHRFAAASLKDRLRR